jgi:hypothetical protein
VIFPDHEVLCILAYTSIFSTSEILNFGTSGAVLGTDTGIKGITGRPTRFTEDFTSPGSGQDAAEVGVAIEVRELVVGVGAVAFVVAVDVTELVVADDRRVDFLGCKSSTPLRSQRPSRFSTLGLSP